MNEGPSKDFKNMFIKQKKNWKKNHFKTLDQILKFMIPFMIDFVVILNIIWLSNL